jgi:hypothetical protein
MYHLMQAIFYRVWIKNVPTILAILDVLLIWFTGFFFLLQKLCIEVSFGSFTINFRISLLFYLVFADSMQKSLSTIFLPLFLCLLLSVILVSYSYSGINHKVLLNYFSIQFIVCTTMVTSNSLSVVILFCRF